MNNIDKRYRTDSPSISVDVAQGAFGWYVDRDLKAKAYDPRIISLEERELMIMSGNFFYHRVSAERTVYILKSVIKNVRDIERVISAECIQESSQQIGTHYRSAERHHSQSSAEASCNEGH